jgi:hypothetical protein
MNVLTRCYCRRNFVNITLSVLAEGKTQLHEGVQFLQTIFRQNNITNIQ